MEYNLINIGTPNANNGDTIRDAFKKSNDNDSFLKTKVDSLEYEHNTLETAFNNAGADKIIKHHLRGVRPIINNPLEGRGYADEVLFDLTKFLDTQSKEKISDYGASISAGLENSDFTIASSIGNRFAGSKVLHTNKYISIYSDIIPVRPRERLYGEMWARHISGDPSRKIYFGIERYDKNMLSIAENNAVTYFVASGTQLSSNSWTKFSGYSIIPETHTPHNGSDGNGCFFIRVRILLNYNGTALGIRQYGGITLKRITKYHDMDFEGTVKCTSLIQTSDKKYKSNIDLIDGEWALSVFKKLKFSFYDFSLTNTKQAGLIAQDIENIIPEAVHTSDNGDKAIDYRYVDIICKAALQYFLKQKS